MTKPPKMHRQPWTKADLKTLKQLVKQRNSADQISKAMKRTVAAIKIKAWNEGISLRVAR